MTMEGNGPQVCLMHAIAPKSHADIMSAMNTFTARDLDRTPAAVLEACRADGRVRIRERGGQSYLIIPERQGNLPISSLPDFGSRRDRLCKGTLSTRFARKLDRALAGE